MWSFQSPCPSVPTTIVYIFLPYTDLSTKAVDHHVVLWEYVSGHNSSEEWRVSFPPQSPEPYYAICAYLHMILPSHVHISFSVKDPIGVISFQLQYLRQALMRQIQKLTEPFFRQTIKQAKHDLSIFSRLILVGFSMIDLGMTVRICYSSYYSQKYFMSCSSVQYGI